MEVEFENYRCFQHATLKLTPLTVVVGANAAGKSSLLRALDPQLALDRLDVWQGRDDLGVRVHQRHDNGLELAASLRPGQDHGLNQLLAPAQSMPSFQLLALDASQLRNANHFIKEMRLSGNGSNIANVFGSLTRAEQTALSKEFCALVPVYSDVDTVPQSAGHITLRFQDKWNPTRWYLPAEVSDGSLFTLAFLLLSHQTPPVDILAIEDPEHGIHPFLLGEIVNLLRRLATGELTGRPMRVVLTTHSPTVLEFSEPEEVRLLQRKDEGSVDILEIPTETEHWRNAFKVYDESLGQAWLSGGLGGAP